MTAAGDMERFFRQRGFGRTIGFGEKPAVLVIDLIRAFTNPDLPLGAPLHDQIAQTVKILAAARNSHVPIFFTSVAYEAADLADAGIWKIKMAGVMTLRTGTPEVEVDPALGRRPEEPVIFKKYASAFFGTDLLTRLNTLRVDTMILTGCTTSGCVRATAVDGLQNGFRVMVAHEAVGDRAQPAHEQSLFDLNAKYADVVSVDEVLSNLASRERVAAGPTAVKE
jgi:nicotinamidase-related amidase